MITKLKLFFLAVASFISMPALANLPYHPIQFPRDEAAHYDNVPYPVSTMTEWWYYNGKLTATNGRQFGYYLNYFFIQYDWKGKKIIIPQFTIQITDIDKQKVYGKRVFFLEKNTYSSTQDLNVMLGKNITLQKNNNTFLLDGVVEIKNNPTLKFSMQLTPSRDALMIMDKGLVDLWDNTNSYYYSYTRLNTDGFIQIGKEKFTLNPQQSISWMDHQWGDFIPLPGKNQWIWTSVQLENGLEINLAVIYDNATRAQVNGWASILMPDGSRLHLPNFEDYSYKPRKSFAGKFPLSYDLTIPSIDLDLQIDALAPGQHVNTIWEGVSEVKGTYRGFPVRGQAYTENTVLK